MTRRRNRGEGKKAILALAAALAGGSTFTSCDTRVKTAVVDGVEQFVLSLFDPATILGDQADDGG